jgi:ribonuclease VapC
LSSPAFVLDASAVLALLNNETGAERVAQCLAQGQAPGCAISAVNLAEVLTKLIDRGVPAEIAAKLLQDLELAVVSVDETAALAIAGLRSATRSFGLSLGDRACLALAQAIKAKVLTADRPWAQLELGVEIELIR